MTSSVSEYDQRLGDLINLVTDTDYRSLYGASSQETSTNILPRHSSQVALSNVPVCSGSTNHQSASVNSDQAMPLLSHVNNNSNMFQVFNSETGHNSGNSDPRQSGVQYVHGSSPRSGVSHNNFAGTGSQLAQTNAIQRLYPGYKETLQGNNIHDRNMTISSNGESWHVNEAQQFQAVGNFIALGGTSPSGSASVVARTDGRIYNTDVSYTHVENQSNRPRPFLESTSSYSNSPIFSHNTSMPLPELIPLNTTSQINSHISANHDDTTLSRVSPVSDKSSDKCSPGKCRLPSMASMRQHVTGYGMGSNQTSNSMPYRNQPAENENVFNTYVNNCIPNRTAVSISGVQTNSLHAVNVTVADVESMDGSNSLGLASSYSYDNDCGMPQLSPICCQPSSVVNADRKSQDGVSLVPAKSNLLNYRIPKSVGQGGDSLGRCHNSKHSPSKDTTNYAKTCSQSVSNSGVKIGSVAPHLPCSDHMEIQHSPAVVRSFQSSNPDYGKCNIFEQRTLNDTVDNTRLDGNVLRVNDSIGRMKEPCYSSSVKCVSVEDRHERGLKRCTTDVDWGVATKQSRAESCTRATSSMQPITSSGGHMTSASISAEHQFVDKQNAMEVVHSSTVRGTHSGQYLDRSGHILCNPPMPVNSDFKKTLSVSIQSMNTSHEINKRAKLSCETEIKCESGTELKSAGMCRDCVSCRNAQSSVSHQRTDNSRSAAAGLQDNCQVQGQATYVHQLSGGNNYVSSNSSRNQPENKSGCQNCFNDDFNVSSTLMQEFPNGRSVQCGSEILNKVECNNDPQSKPSCMFQCEGTGKQPMVSESMCRDCTDERACSRTLVKIEGCGRECCGGPEGRGSTPGGCTAISNGQQSRTWNGSVQSNFLSSRPICSLLSEVKAKAEVCDVKPVFKYSNSSRTDRLLHDVTELSQVVGLLGRFDSGDKKDIKLISQFTSKSCPTSSSQSISSVVASNSTSTGAQVVAKSLGVVSCIGSANRSGFTGNKPGNAIKVKQIVMGQSITQVKSSVKRPTVVYVKNTVNCTKSAVRTTHDCERKTMEARARRPAVYTASPTSVLSSKPLNDVSLGDGSEFVGGGMSNISRIIQDCSCAEISGLQHKCRECTLALQDQFISDYSSLVANCRFYAFRRLSSTSSGFLAPCGFCDPYEADATDVSLWMPLYPIVDPPMCVETALYIVACVGSKFCELVEQESDAICWNVSRGAVVWKRAVYEVREMCDSCETTIFNVHWACGRCGFVVCLDCYATVTRQSCTRCAGVQCGCLKWLDCCTGQEHSASELMLTQIIPSDVLGFVGEMLHTVCETWNLPLNCPCYKTSMQSLYSDNPASSVDRKHAVRSEAQNRVKESVDMKTLWLRYMDSGRRGNLNDKRLYIDLVFEPPRKKLTHRLEYIRYRPDTKTVSSIGLNQVVSASQSKAVTTKIVVSADGSSVKDSTVTSQPVMKLSSIVSSQSVVPATVGNQSVNNVSMNSDSKQSIISVRGSNQYVASANDQSVTDSKQSVISVRGSTQSIMPANDRSVSESIDCKPDISRTAPCCQDCKNKQTCSEGLCKSSPVVSQSFSASVNATTSNTHQISLVQQNHSSMISLKNSTDKMLSSTNSSKSSQPPRILHPFSRFIQLPPPHQRLLSTPSLFPDVPHSWLDNGRLLQLLDPFNTSNVHLFREQWRHSRPILVSNCQHRLDPSLWTPESFSREFGDRVNDLVDCARKRVVRGYQMKQFWEGFECVARRLKDEEGKPMVLKLKDWPPTEDFCDVLPSRFHNLLEALPLPDYTRRDGCFNLVSRLPAFFVRPDLGPKMYNAYGSAVCPRVGSTNLHLDVSDAVNLIMYVGVPQDDADNLEKAALKAMEEASCCTRTKDRVFKNNEKIGALWHIFDPQDAIKIRQLLHKVSEERGDTIEVDADPIHDQSWYLDERLRERLLKEYNVEGYTVVQCVGDAIFIPAGAPHQVRNLHSCIKAAEDFVSPENLSNCFRMMQEFRHLSDTHTNHEDKLQVKNVIYHVVKDAVAVLQNKTPSS